MSLYSKRFSGIEIQNDGKVLLIRKKNSNLISYIDTLSNEFNMKGNIKTNSLTLIENEGNGNDEITLKAPIITDNYTLTLPTDNGSDGNVLSNDGTGNLTWIPTSSGSSIFNNVYNVDDINGNDTNDGLNNPVKTIQKALDLIGSATSTAEWELDSKREHIIKIAIGTYTENLTIPLRPWLLFEIIGATIDGDITWNIPNNIISATYNTSPQIIFKSTGLREFWPDNTHVNHGIKGSITMTSLHNSGNMFPQIIIIESGVEGDISMQGTMSGGQIRLYHSYVKGQLIGPLSGGSGATVWGRGPLNNPDFGDTFGIGGAKGRLSLGMLDNILISGIIENTQVITGRLHNTRFLPNASHDFSNYTGMSIGPLYMDNATIRNYYENITLSQRGDVVIGNLIDEMDSIPQPISTQTGTSYTITQSDVDHQISMNNIAANTVTIPVEGGSFDPSINHKIEIIQLGVGTTTVEGAVTVTVNGTLGGSISIAGQYRNIFTKKIATNNWIIYGNVM